MKQECKEHWSLNTLQSAYLAHRKSSARFAEQVEKISTISSMNWTKEFKSILLQNSGLFSKDDKDLTLIIRITDEGFCFCDDNKKMNDAKDAYSLPRISELSYDSWFSVFNL